MDTLRIAVNGVSYTEGEMYKPDADPFSGPVTNLAPWNFVVLATLMFIVTSLSLFENFTVMLATYKFKQLRQPLNYIIVNLSLADFLVSLTGGVISFVTNAKGYFFLGKWACVLEGFAVTYFGIVAMWSLAVLSFERFFVICRPLGNIRLRGKHAALGLLFVWTFSFIWTIPPVFGWCSYTPSKIGTTCEPNWYSDNISNHTYIITFFITCFIMPLGVIVYSYGKLLQKLRKVSHGRLGNAKKPDRQVTRMVVVMIVAYLVGWTPYAAFSIIVTICPTIYLDPRLAAAPAFFSKTAACYNPVIYVFMNKQFRKCLIQLFTGKPMPENTNATSERQGMTEQSGMGGEMSAIAARIPFCGNDQSNDETSPIECSTFAQMPIPENKVCPV
ncbi:LOW QUALITY PROTEIN: vertebrate ancient long opsin a [Esox lucius]|uniref:LOW QUALITY PROTEIN: vertebrate ancient long opsin a n=1 Tax=Esox lucius TaxID=8010 RepID=UPI000661CBB8|nr:LOW QUALITY PROTEIN: vertebrate ancient long opsin a [Esox lucius]